MHAPLVLLLMLAFAFLATVLEVRLLGSHRKPVGAAIYLTIGFLCGPSALGVLSVDHLQALSGIEGVACTFVGLSCGLPLGKWRTTSHRPDRIGFGLLIMAITTFIVGGFSFFTLRVVPGFDGAEYTTLLVSALTLGVAAAVSSPSVMQEAVASQLADGPVSRLMPTALATSRMVAVCVFGVAVAFLPGAPMGFAWTVLASVLSGIVLGIAFHLMVGDQNDPHRLMVATLGTLALGAGLSESLSLAPIMVGLLSGLSIGTLSPVSESLSHTIRRLERPAIVALFLFGGAHFSVQDPVLFVLAVGYVAVRFISLRLAAVLARPVSKELEYAVPGLWRAYLYQGALTAAIALNFEALMPGAMGLLVEGTLLVAAIVNPLISWNAARDLLRDVGETGRQRPARPTSEALNAEVSLRGDSA